MTRFIGTLSLRQICTALSGPARRRPRREPISGSELLDPQYEESPADISREDYKHYFEPIALTDDSGGPADWLKPYVPSSAKQPARQMLEPTEVEPVSAYPRTPTDLPVGRASVI